MASVAAPMLPPAVSPMCATMMSAPASAICTRLVAG